MFKGLMVVIVAFSLMSCVTTTYWSDVQDEAYTVGRAVFKGSGMEPLPAVTSSKVEPNKGLLGVFEDKGKGKGTILMALEYRNYDRSEVVLAYIHELVHQYQNERLGLSNQKRVENYEILGYISYLIKLNPEQEARAIECYYAGVLYKYAEYQGVHITPLFLDSVKQYAKVQMKLDL